MKTHTRTVADFPSSDNLSNQETRLEDDRPLVSIIAPAYNESAILQKNLTRLLEYTKTLEDRYRWEFIIVNDGSKDNTGQLAEEFAQDKENVCVIHHMVNKNLGATMQTGFKNAKGDYVVVVDIDLSYHETHIEKLLRTLIEHEADVVIASPYMKGGKNTAVPFFRLLLSKVVNRIMRVMSPAKIHTYTSMVRAYRGSFLRKLNLKSNTYSINPEIIHKGIILRARILEIPAHLDWSFRKELGKTRTSSIRVFKGITAGLMSSFIFRPYAFFMSIGVTLFIVALYVIIWILIHTISAFPEVATDITNFETRFGEAIFIVFKERPHSFLVGGISLIIALQFLGIGFLSLQNKRYFDELFHITTSVLNNQMSTSLDENDNRIE